MSPNQHWTAVDVVPNALLTQSSFSKAYILEQTAQTGKVQVSKADDCIMASRLIKLKTLHHHYHTLRHHFRGSKEAWANDNADMKERDRERESAIYVSLFISFQQQPVY